MPKQLLNLFTKKSNGSNTIVVRSFDNDREFTLPDADSFDCEIETPQFHGSPDKFHLHIQKGTYYKNEMKFYPRTSIFGYPTGGDHTVQFHNQNDIKKALRKIL